MGADLNHALDTIDLPAWITDANGVIQWQNERAQELFGDTRGQKIFHPVTAASQPTARIEFAKVRLGTARKAAVRLTVVTPSGEHLPVNAHVVALRSGRRIVGVFGITEVDQPLPATGAQHELTPRQLEMLELLGLGFSTDQIAERLHLSTETVRNHIRGLLRRLSVHSRLEAVIEGRRRGLIPDLHPHHPGSRARA